MNVWFALAASLGLAYTAAAIGGLASINARSFYADLKRPAWAPPGWLFGPVWTLLYFLIGISAWLVWRDFGLKPVDAFVVYIVQLSVNALWSWLFFYWHRGAFAFVAIVVLWCLIVANVVLFWRLVPVAGLLLLPYLAWVSFASVLALAVWRANPDRL